MWKLEWKWPLLLAAVIFMACGSDGSGSDPSGDGGRGGSDAGEAGRGGGAGRGGQTSRDTSAFKGRLAWTGAPGFGAYLWDLPSSKFVYQRHAEDYVEEGLMFNETTLSADGSTLAYAVRHGFILTAYQSYVTVRDAASGELVKYSEKGLEEWEVLQTIRPSLSADGSRVAVASSVGEVFDDGFGELPSDHSALSIEVWDRLSDERIQITDGDSTDTAPFISSDGERVLFLSDRDRYEGDFYIAEVTQLPTPRRIPFDVNPSITDLGTILQYDMISVSGDLRWVAFIAKSHDDPFQSGYFLLDTDDGSITTLDVEPVGVAQEDIIIKQRTSIAISEDGSTLAYVVYTLSEDGFTTQLLTAPRSEPTNTTLALSTSEPPLGFTVALSPDGAHLAYVRGAEQELWVSDANGDNPALVASDKDKVVGISIMGGGHFLSFGGR